MYYSVVVGRKIGIFLAWKDCREFINNYTGAKFRKWETLREATQHLNKHGITHGVIIVHDSGNETSLADYCSRLSLAIPEEIEYEHCSLFNLYSGLYISVVSTLGMYILLLAFICCNVLIKSTIY